jgi:hypothetical protein
MNSFPHGDVLAVCAQYGPQLHVQAGLDPVRVMAAIASNESSMGVNCGPRHEPAYEANGAAWARAAMAPLLAKYPPVGSPPQSPAACSYGPWQMMFVNFQNCTPDQLLSDIDACALNFVRFFNGYVIATKKASNLAEIGEVWNTGRITSDPAYVAKLQAAYDAAASLFNS